MKIISVVGARPNFMKIAPIVRAIKKEPRFKHVLVHTGQHYDFAMSDSFFKELGIPRPDINLEVGSGTHAQQTASIMVGFEKVLLKEKPDLVLVVGDVNSTLACSLVAKKLHMDVAHVEAGLRSGDRRMPEEINRIVTDSISDILFTTCADADINLIKEGKVKKQIFFVGNVMIDTLLHNVKKAQQSRVMNKYSLKNKNFVLVTLHRPSNVDSPKALKELIRIFKEIQKEIKIIFPMHPRTQKNLFEIIKKKDLAKISNLLLIDPLGYYDFLKLMMNARCVITDSGGIQEETTVLGVPCLTARENTERPITITEGTNILVGTDRNKILKETLKIINGKIKKGRRPKYWDGKASERIVRVLKKASKKK